MTRGSGEARTPEHQRVDRTFLVMVLLHCGPHSAGRGLAFVAVGILAHAAPLHEEDNGQAWHRGFLNTWATSQEQARQSQRNTLNRDSQTKTAEATQPLGILVGSIGGAGGGKRDG